MSGLSSVKDIPLFFFLFLTGIHSLSGMSSFVECKRCTTLCNMVEAQVHVSHSEGCSHSEWYEQYVGCERCTTLYNIVETQVHVSHSEKYKWYVGCKR